MVLVTKADNLVTPVSRNGNGHAPECNLRGCSETGVYFLMRPLRSGKLDKGFYCDEHEKKYGRKNLRLLAKEVDGRVGRMVDELGEFDAILV